MTTASEKVDHYKILDVPSNATKDDIRAAYKKMALKWHPDRHMVDKEIAKQRFIEIHDAYRALTDKRERRHRTKQSDKNPKSAGRSSPSSSSIPKPATQSPSSGQSPPENNHSPQHRGNNSPSPSSPKPTTRPPPPSKPGRSTPEPCAQRTHSVPGASASRGSSAHRSAGSTDSRTTPPSSSKPGLHTPTHTKKYSSLPHGSKSHAPPSPKPTAYSSSFGTDSHGCSFDRTTGSDPHTTPPSSPEPEPEPTRKSTSSHCHESPSSEPLTSPKPSSPTKLRKQSKPSLRHLSGESTPKTAPKRRKPDYKLRRDNIIAEYSDSPHVLGCVPPTYPRGAGTSKEWLYPLKLTLEELFHGARFRFRLTRYLLSNKKRNVILDVDVPPGCQHGTKIVCRGVGHERKDGTLQDVAFVVEELVHERFDRVEDDLIMEVKLPWVESLETEKGEVYFEGVDGEELVVKINYPKHKAHQGSHVIIGAGMPVREGGEVVGRGNLVFKWEISSSPASKWETLRRVLRFKR